MAGRGRDKTRPAWMTQAGGLEAPSLQGAEAKEVAQDHLHFLSSLYSTHNNSALVFSCILWPLPPLFPPLFLSFFLSFFQRTNFHL